MESVERENLVAALSRIGRNPTAEAATIRRLDGLLTKWQETGETPPECGCLSGGEWRALALAVGHAVADPIRDFLHLDDWLQRFVLERRGLKAFCNTRIASDT